MLYDRLYHSDGNKENLCHSENASDASETSGASGRSLFQFGVWGLLNPLTGSRGGEKFGFLAHFESFQGYLGLLLNI